MEPFSHLFWRRRHSRRQSKVAAAFRRPGMKIPQTLSQPVRCSSTAIPARLLVRCRPGYSPTSPQQMRSAANAFCRNSCGSRRRSNAAMPPMPSQATFSSIPPAAKCTLKSVRPRPQQRQDHSRVQNRNKRCPPIRNSGTVPRRSGWLLNFARNIRSCRLLPA